MSPQVARLKLPNHALADRENCRLKRHLGWFEQLPYPERSGMRTLSVTTSRTSPLSAERGSVFVEAVVVVPAFIFLIFASMQLFVISWRLSQVQLEASELARTLAVPVNNQYPCATVRAEAAAFGTRELGVTAASPVTIQVMEKQANGSYSLSQATTCPTANFGAAERETAVLTLSYDVPLFFAQLVPGGVNFTYRGVAVAALEKPQGGSNG